MTIDPHGHDQEPLFPTSNEERRELQEQLVDAIEAVYHAEQEQRQQAKANAGRVAEARKKADELARILRQSRPRK